MKSTGILLYIALLLLALPRLPQAQPTQHGSLTFTIYQNGIALVHDVRQLDLAGGRNQFHLSGLPPQIQFNSILPVLDGTVHALTLEPQRPGFARLMEDIVGQEVRLDHTDGSSVTGKLVHYRSNLVMIEQADGSRVMLPGIEGYRITAMNIPDVDTPFPRILLDAETTRGGRQSVQLYYLMHGLRWETEFTLQLADDERSAVFNGWNVLENRTDMSFNNATVHLMAGELNMGRTGSAPRNDMMMMRAAVAESVAFDGGEEAASFFEFQRFTLPGRVSLSPGETVKRALIPERTVPVTKRFRYTSTDRRMEVPQAGMVQIQFDIDNAADGALGMALPSGLVRMFKSDGHRLQLIGQDHIPNTPAGGALRLTSGMAFDILVLENVVRQNRISDRIHEQVNRIELSSERTDRLTVEVMRPVHTGQRITESSVPFTMISASLARFEVPLSPGQSTTLEFTLRTER